MNGEIFYEPIGRADLQVRPTNMFATRVLFHCERARIGVPHLEIHAAPRQLDQPHSSGSAL